MILKYATFKNSPIGLIYQMMNFKIRILWNKKKITSFDYYVPVDHKPK